MIFRVYAMTRYLPPAPQYRVNRPTRELTPAAGKPNRDSDRIPITPPISRLQSNVLCLARGIDGSLTALLDTTRLRIASVTRTERDLNRIRAVFCDPDVMRYYSRGMPKSEFSVQKRWRKWSGLWAQAIPYSGLSICDKVTDSFVGFIRLSASKEPGIAELTFALVKSAWGKGYGTEAAQAVIGTYVPALRRRGYLIQGAMLGCVVATVHPDNGGSSAILEKSGLHHCGVVEKYGKVRLVYSSSPRRGEEGIESLQEALTGGSVLMASKNRGNLAASRAS